MPLYVTELDLHDWRNFADEHLAFDEGMCVLVGHNAAGKTNIVEALQMLTAGFSFRKPKPIQLIREDQEQARIQARIEGDGRQIDIRLDVTDRSRRFTRNGKRITAGEVPTTLMSVLFNPDDLSFVKRGASYRRDEIDAFGSQSNRGYARLMSAYSRAVEQRNRLLKEDYPDHDLLDAWDASVALGGAALIDARVRLLKRLRPYVADIYQQISDGEELGCTYESSLGEDLEGMSRDEICDLFARVLAESREEDLRRQQTTHGPQRDDVAFTINGRSARDFGSQGQQRSVVLAWKMAEVKLSRDLLGMQPLLLLDDVMSELDESRRAAMTTFIQSGIQTVITTTNLGYFTDDLLDGAEVVRIDG